MDVQKLDLSGTWEGEIAGRQAEIRALKLEEGPAGPYISFSISSGGGAGTKDISAFFGPNPRFRRKS